MGKQRRLELLKRCCSNNREAIGVTRARDMKIRKNVEDSIDSIIAYCGGRAQLFIEEEIPGWEKGSLHLTEVRYKKGDEESLLLFNFRPKKHFSTENPRVLVIFKRVGADTQEDRTSVVQYYVPFNTPDDSIDGIYQVLGEEIYLHHIEEEGTLGFDKLREVMEFESELEDLNYRNKV
jgi:hypothetical protein